MKTAETKTPPTRHQSQTDQPFFQKEGRESAFFSDLKNVVQAKPFFDTFEEPVDPGIDSLKAENTGHSLDNGKIQKKTIFEGETEPVVESIQLKPSTNGLKLGHPGDKYEMEADAMVDQVVKTKFEENSFTFPEGLSDKPASIKISADKEEEQEEVMESKPDTQEKPILKSEASEEPVQTKPEVENGFNDQSSEAYSTIDTITVDKITTPTASIVQPKCEACEQKEKEEVQQEEPEAHKKPIFDSAEDPPEDEDPNIQRRALEMEKTEYPILFKRIPDIQLSSGGGSESNTREKIVKEAQKMVGKIEAKKDDGSGRRVGAEHLLKIFHLAAKDEWPDEVIENVKYTKEFPHWCGIFSVYAIKKAGIDLGYWQMGKGVSAFGTLEPTDDPQPGDIGYFTKLQHHCIIKKVNGDSIDSIDGNSGNFSEVKERTRPRDQFHAFFTAFTGSEKHIQKKENTGGTAFTGDSLQGKLNGSKGKGFPLDETTQGHMESAFGADFKQVSIHTDSEAVEMNKDLNAQAFTHGSDIYFNKGKYKPETTSGKHLLAHELTHTVQQGKSIKTNIQKQEAESDRGQALIVENHEEPSAGQMRKSDFLTKLNDQVCQTVDQGLQGLPFSSDSCPYIKKAFSRHKDSSASHLEKTLKRYAPDTLSVKTAALFITKIKDKARKAVDTWVRTGDLSGVPDEISTRIPEDIKSLVKLNRTFGNIGRILKKGVNILSGIPGLFFKAKGDGPSKVVNPISLASGLENGQSLSGQVRGKMENAFESNFSNVQIHTDHKAPDKLNARAFTLGNHIAFGSGEYQPGTLVGDALIAHELAHVEQQKAADSTIQSKSNFTESTSSLEREADDVAVSAVLSLHERENGLKPDKKNLPQLKSKLQLQRCSKSEPVTIPPEFEKSPQISEADLKVVDKIGAMDLDDELKKQYKEVEMLRNAAGQKPGVGMFFSSFGGPRTAGAKLVISKKLEEARAKLATLAKKYGIEGGYYSGFLELENKFIKMFQLYAIQVAFAIMKLSEKRVEGEGEKYGPASADGDAFDNFWLALEPTRKLKAKYDEEYQQIEDSKAPFGDPVDKRAEMMRIMKAKTALREKYNKTLHKNNKGLAERFPLLADKRLEISLIGTSDKTQLKKYVGKIVSDRLKDIQKTRQNLAENPEQIWKLDLAIEHAKNSFGVAKGSLYELMIQKKASDVKGMDVVIDLALAVLALGLGLLSGGSGTIAVIGILGSGVVSGISFYRSYEEYQLKTAAGGTDFDIARALSSEDPSFFWVALDLIFFAADIAAAARLLRAARPIIKPLQEAGASSDEVVEALKKSDTFTDPSNFKPGVKPGEVAERLGQSYADAQAVVGDLATIAKKMPGGKLPSSVEELLKRDKVLRKRVLKESGLMDASNIKDWEEIAKIGPVNHETYDILLKNKGLREALGKYPEAAKLLKKCASPCFPPNATPTDVARINEAISKLGKDVDYARLNQYLYQNRGPGFSDAVKKLKDDLTVLDDVKIPHEVAIPPAWAGKVDLAHIEELNRLGVAPSQLEEIMKKAAAHGMDGDAFIQKMIKAATHLGAPKSMRHWGKVLYALESADPGIFKTAEFLLDNMAGGKTVINKINHVLTKLSIEDISKIRALYPGADVDITVDILNRFIKRIKDPNVNKISGAIKKAGLKAGPGVDDPDIWRLNRALDKLGPGPHSHQKIHAELKAQRKIDNKILTGRQKAPQPAGAVPAGASRTVIGGHSPSILTNPDFRVYDPAASPFAAPHNLNAPAPATPTAALPVNPDGTLTVKYVKKLHTDPVTGVDTWSKAKPGHTVAPIGSTNKEILQAGDKISKGGKIVFKHVDGRVLREGKVVVGGKVVEWQTITNKSGKIVSSFPTGGNGLVAL